MNARRVLTVVVAVVIVFVVVSTVLVGNIFLSGSSSSDQRDPRPTPIVSPS